jgi:hypothetical protein
MAKFIGAIIKCFECGQEFKVPPVRKNTAKYCSKECADKHRTDSRRVELVEKHCLRCGKVFYEYPCHAERRKYCSYDCSSKELSQRCGGRGDEHFYNRAFWRDLRSLILERDMHKCQKCGDEKRRLSVHHIIERKKGGKDEESNLITLCNPCHKRKA